MKRFWIWWVALILGIILGWALTYQHQPEQPYCPTEDSCTIDYRDGSWHIEEVTP